MADIDSLNIEISANCDKAYKSIDELAQGLTNLNKALSFNMTRFDKLSSGLNQLSTAAAGLKNLNSSKINNFSSSLQRLSSVDASKLNTLSHNMRSFANSMNNLPQVDLSSLASATSTLSRLGSKNVTQATHNLPALSAQLQNFIRQMNNIGSLSFDMNGMGQLIASISRLGGKAATQAVVNIPKLGVAMNNLMSTLSRAPRVSNNLIDMTNALARLARTGSSSGKAVNSLTSSLNAFSKSSIRANISAKSLFSAFSKIYILIRSLTGVFKFLKESIDLSSDLTEVENVVQQTFGKYQGMVEKFTQSSITDFGMSELTAKNVASRFQAMGTAMGFAQGQMANMSLELTKLTADMASFYNESQDDVAKRLQSIFTGETEPLRRYGLDLTQATLKEWALKQGLDADISSMSQAQKTLLRYQYVMQNTAAAQGDFARTSSSWHNQLVILTENFHTLQKVVGNFAITALKPFIAALNQALVYVVSFAETVTNALGAIFGWKYENSGGGTVDDWSSSMDDFADSTGTAADNAKKLKSNLLGIDELNVLSTDTSSSSGAGGSGNVSSPDTSKGELVETPTIFEKYESSIKNLEQLGQKIGDKLKSALEGIDWNGIYKKADNFGTGLADFLNGLISPGLFYDLGKTVANSINTALHFLDSFGSTFDWSNFGKSIAAGMKGFFENWDAGLTGKTLSTFAKGILEAMSASLNQLSADETFNTIGQRLVDFVCGIDWGGLAWDLTGFFIACENALVNFPVDFAEGVGQRILDKIFGTDENGESNVKVKIPEGVKNSIGTEFLTLFNPGVGVAKEAIDIINTLIKVNDDLESNVSKVADSIKEKIEFLKSMAFMKWLEIQSWFETDIKPWFSADTWVGIFDGIKEAASTKWDEIKEWWTNSAIFTWWNDDVLPWFSLDTWLTLLNNIKESFSTKFGETITKWKSDINTWWTVNVAPWFTKQRWDTMLTKIPEAFKNAFKLAANGAIEFLNGVISGVESLVNRAIDGLKKLAEAASKVPGISFSIDIPNVSLPRIPKFSTGGFPEDGLFLANSTELVGQFSNGKTAVANNEMIVAGIEEAAYRGFSRAYEDNSREINLLSEILDAVREGKEISIDGRSLVSAVEERSNRNGYSFG